MAKEPPFELAVLWNKSIKMPIPCYVEPKYDGIRFFIFTGPEIKVISRNGKRNKCLEDLLERVCNLPPGYVLDCEAFYRSWNTTISMIQRCSNIRNIKLHVFDMLTLKEFKSRRTPPLRVRKVRLKEWLSQHKCRPLVYVRHWVANSEDEVKKYYKKLLDQGFEGAMVKDPDAPYQFKRTRHWLKLKEREYYTYKCVGVEEGTGRNKGRLGALILQRPDGVKFKVGDGFTDKEREELWKNPPIGKCVEVELVKSPQKKSKAIFPVFVRVREDIKC